MCKRFFLVLFLFLTTCFQAFSTHIISGEMYWKHVGNRVFDVYVLYYHDCAGVSFTWVPLTVQWATGSTTVNVTETSSSLVDYFSPTCAPSNPCVAQNYLRLRKNVGRFRVNLSNNSSCNFTFFIEDCCRMTYLTQIPSTINSTRIWANMQLCGVDSAQWNSPQFVARPHVNTSAGGLRQISFLVNSPDASDSVVYELFAPLSGANPQNYITGYAYDRPLTYTGYPQTATTPYGYGFGLDPSNGQLVFTPTTANQSSVYAVKASTYKYNGQSWVLASQITRDVLIHVQNATLNYFPHFKNPPSDIRICDSTTNYVDLIVVDSNQTDTLTLRVIGDIPDYQIEDRGQTGLERHYRLWLNLAPDDWRPHPYNFVLEALDNHCGTMAIGGAQLSLRLYATIDSSFFTNTEMLMERICNQVSFSPGQLLAGTEAYWVLGTDTFQSNSFIRKYTSPANKPAQLVLRYSSCTQILTDTLRIDSVYHFQPELLGFPPEACERNEVTVNWQLSGGLGHAKFLFEGNGQDSANYRLLISDSVYYFQVIDSSGCEADTTLAVKIFPRLGSVYADETEVCSGNTEPFYLKATPVGGKAPYQVTWAGNFVSDSILIASDTAVILPFAITDSLGCFYSDTLSVTVRPTPQYTVTGEGPNCYRDSFHLSVQHSLNPQMVAFNWGSGFQSQSSVSLFPLQDSSVVLRIRDSVHCTVTDTLRLTYYESRAFFLIADTSLCEDDTLLMAWPSPWSADSFFWHSGFAQSNDSLIRVPYSSNGTDSIHLDVWSPEGCHYTGFTRVAVKKRPDLELVMQDIRWCENDPEFSLADSVVQQGGTWYVDGIVDSLARPAVLGAGDHDFVYVYDSMGCNTAASHRARIRNVPIVQYSLVNDKGNAPLVTQFFLSVSADTVYQLAWDFGNLADSLDTSSQSMASYTYHDKGFYSPGFIVATDYCWTATYLDSAVEVSMGVGWKELTTVFRIYPNPGKGKYRIEMGESQPVAIHLYTSLGQEIKLPAQIPGKTMEIDIRHLPAGTYLVRWEDDNQNQGSYQLIHQP